jgi:hypothetical protein
LRKWTTSRWRSRRRRGRRRRRRGRRRRKKEAQRANFKKTKTMVPRRQAHEEGRVAKDAVATAVLLEGLACKLQEVAEAQAQEAHCGNPLPAWAPKTPMQGLRHGPLPARA